MVGVQGSSDPNRELLDAAALCGHLVPDGTVYAFLAEHRQRLFPDELFADLFPSGRGRPSVPGRCDRHGDGAAGVGGPVGPRRVRALRDRHRAGRSRPGWRSTMRGSTPTVLTLWRNKLRAVERPERIFDAVREVIAATGVLAGKTRRALDSTVLDDAVATQDTVTQLVVADPPGPPAGPWAAAVERGGARLRQRRASRRVAWDDPAAHDSVVTGLVNDALASSPPSRASSSTTSRPTRSGCWRWSPAKTSNPATTTGRGGSPASRPGPGDLHRRSRDPAHAQVRGRATATASRRTSRSNPTPG